MEVENVSWIWIISFTIVESSCILSSIKYKIIFKALLVGFLSPIILFFYSFQIKWFPTIAVEVFLYSRVACTSSESYRSFWDIPFVKRPKIISSNNSNWSQISSNFASKSPFRNWPFLNFTILTIFSNQPFQLSLVFDYDVGFYLLSQNLFTYELISDMTWLHNSLY